MFFAIKYTYSEDALGEILLEIAETKYSASSIQNALAKYGYNVGAEIAAAIKELFDDTASMPVNMYEAKPERAVGFEEVKFAVVPDDIDPALKSELQSAIPDVREYAAGNEAERLKQLNSRGDVKFKRRTNTDVNLTHDQLARFYEKVGEIQTGKSKQFKKARTGHYIFAIDNKLVYTNGEFEKPSVHKVVDINLGDETDIDVVRQIIFRWEERECSGEQARRLLESMYGKRVVDGHDFGVHGSNAGTNGRRKGKTGGSLYRGSETAVSDETLAKKYSLRTLTPSDREMMSIADKYAVTKPQKELLGRYRAKTDELIDIRAKLGETRSHILRLQRQINEAAPGTSGKMRTERVQYENRAKIYETQINRLNEEVYKLLQSKTMQTVLGEVINVVNSQEKLRRKEFVRQYREGREKTDLRRKIKALCDDFDRRLKNPTESKYIPQELVKKVIDVRELISICSSVENG